MLRDAALAANAAWLVVALSYLLTGDDLDAASLYVFVLIGIGLPVLNLLALRPGTARSWD